MEEPKSPIGDRIRRARRQAHRSQVTVAGLCGITVDYLSQIERGVRQPSLDLLLNVARELGLPAAVLLGEDPRPAVPAPRTDPSVAQALLGHPAPGGTPPPTPAALRERVERIWQIWQTSPTRYTDAAPLLPALIAGTQHAIRVQRLSPDATARREVLRCAADLYGMLRSYCRRTGRIDLALLVADRALRAAEDADDPLRIAAAHWNLGHVVLGDDQPEAAEDIAMQAIGELRSTAAVPGALAMAGALQLVAVASKTRRRQWWEARDLLRKIEPCAQRAAEGNVMHTVFGPTNLELHRLSLEMTAGEHGEALRIADQLDISRLPSRERRFTFVLDMARCYDLRREDPAVLVHLLDLEELAPEDLSHSAEARDLVKRLRHRARPTYRRQIAALSERIGLP